MTRERKHLSDLACDITLIGGGKMGSALLLGWLDAGLDPSLVRVADPAPSPSLRAMAAQRSFAVDTALNQLNPGVVVLAVKPQIIDPVSAATAPMMGGACLVLSMVAGITLGRLRASFPAAKAIVRGMPNLAASVGAGATILVPEPRVEAGERELTERLLGVSGTVEWLDDEGLMDAGTALSGSGPGYVFYMVECLAKAGEQAGLPGDMAAKLARQTVAGAGALLAQSPTSAAGLRTEVTSPGGTTQAGLAVLAREGRLASAFADAVAAAAARSRELAS